MMEQVRSTPHPPKDVSSRILLWIIMFAVAGFSLWATFAELDEVAVGEGKVTPASRGQLIQSLEGGLLLELSVREGDIVEAGQQLATLDPVQARSSVEEVLVRIAALRARAARLQAEIAGHDRIDFPPEITDQIDLMEREKQLFKANRKAFAENIANLKEQVQLSQHELKIATPLLKTGAASEVEIIRLKQKATDFSSKLAATEGEYYVALRADFAKTMAELEPLLKEREGRADQLRRTALSSPAKGIVKDVRISTIGGVVPPGGVLMEIVPFEDQLLIEAKLSPRDIAFIHPDQEATVKITAYDSAIYGTLPARVTMVSPDTIEDEADKRIFYYRVYVRTDQSYLETADGRRHPIMPGMVATAEIRTGRKTVLSYLLKPLNKAGEALRER